EAAASREYAESMKPKRTMHPEVVLLAVACAGAAWLYQVAAEPTVRFSEPVQLAQFGDAIGEGDQPIGGPMAYGEPVGNGPIGGPMIYGDPVGNGPIGGPSMNGDPVGNAPIGNAIGGDGDTLY